MCCVSWYFKCIITQHKWEIIDEIPNNTNKLLVSATGETYKAYRYIIDLYRVCTSSSRPLLNTSTLKAIDEENIFDLNILGKCCVFSDEFILSNWERFDTRMLLSHQVLPLKVLNVLIEKYSGTPSIWMSYAELMCRHQQLPLFLIDKYQDIINWNALSQNKQALTINLMRKYRHKLAW